MKTLYDTKQVAEILGFSLSKTRAMSAAGEIPRIKIGRSVRYDPVKLDEWIAEHFEDASKKSDGVERNIGSHLGRRDPSLPVTFTLD